MVGDPLPPPQVVVCTTQTTALFVSFVRHIFPLKMEGVGKESIAKADRVRHPRCQQDQHLHQQMHLPVQQLDVSTTEDQQLDVPSRREQQDQLQQLEVSPTGVLQAKLPVQQPEVPPTEDQLLDVQPTRDQQSKLPVRQLEMSPKEDQRAQLPFMQNHQGWSSI